MKAIPPHIKAEIREAIQKQSTKPCPSNHLRIGFYWWPHEANCVKGHCEDCGCMIVVKAPEVVFK